MRAITVPTAFTFGVLLMTAAAQPAPAADEKKDEKKVEKKETRGLKVTVKSWDSSGKKFLNPAEVDARKLEYNGEVWFYVPGRQAIGTGEPRKGSEIIEADGTVWVAKTGASTGRGEYCAAVEKKAPKKKP